jgi:hypothetical protein
MSGDSFTMSHAVEAEDAIPQNLARPLMANCVGKDISVLNAGCDAGGPLQELGTLCEVGLALEPDLVILQVYPGNDILDDVYYRCDGHSRNWAIASWPGGSATTSFRNTFPPKESEPGQVIQASEVHAIHG